MSEVAGNEVPTVGLSDIESARELLEGVAIVTPMEESRWLSALAGGPVSLKCENLQRTGSFKARGAYTRIARLSEEERAHGVVAASAGNHAQGVALAAQLLGIRSTVFMPEGAPIPKEKATRAYGADVVFHGRYLEDALVEAHAFARDTGAVLIHPFDHVDIVAGQGTAGLEILEQAPDVETVLVPTGGGGLLAGIAIAIKALRPGVRVIGVQAEGAAAYPGSLEEGCPVPLPSMSTMADGIAVGRPGDITFAAVRDHVDEIITVSEDALARAVLATLERAKMVVEPAGAAAVAALLEHPTAFATPAVAVLSGGNIDPLLLGKVIRHGMAAAGRYLNLRVCIPDTPGGLAHLLTEISAAGANVLEVAHERISPTLHVDEVEVRLQLETRGEPHAQQVLARLDEHDYRVMQ
ncbi:threonine dehydratase [Nocardioides sp. Root1257]|uniref:threonine ammonia-lyase n=1 Tax=unclassified Nocardioides TaxID=2615069 RepID=UPI0006FDA0F9|nr:MULTISPECIES: threonine ammonia-lyase [unclassified Nocardioides]KQW48918.1 threonine dehydratase [Nocardioides sp. Root1257]KRC48093.1 threonine dehydratase [Nocardioides sp. Root224]